MNLSTRHTIRLSGYDYSQEGWYFVTMCTQNRECMFVDVINQEIILNDVGNMIDRWWLKIQQKYQNTQLDKYQIMPNHIHGIIRIVGVDPRVDPNNPHGSEFGRTHETKIGRTHGSEFGRTHGSAPTIGIIMQWFKTMTTNEYIRNVKSNNWPKFDKRIWQRNYYERIIRDESDYLRINQYITSNPQNWKTDHDNPENV